MKSSAQRVLAVAALAVVDLYRRRDLFVALILAAVVVLPLLSFQFFGMSGIVRYLGEVTLLLVWIFSVAIGVGVAARQIQSEIESRTIFPLLAKPVKRAEILLGKFLGAFAATGSAVVLFYLCFLALFVLKGGGGVNWAIWGQALLFHLLFVLVLTALTLLVSLILTPSATLTICTLVTGGMLLFGETLAGFAAKMPWFLAWLGWGVHALAPHMEFFDLRRQLVHGWPPVELSVSLAVAGYALCYSGVLLLFATVVFQRKKL